MNAYTLTVDPTGKFVLTLGIKIHKCAKGDRYAVRLGHESNWLMKYLHRRACDVAVSAPLVRLAKAADGLVTRMTVVTRELAGNKRIFLRHKLDVRGDAADDHSMYVRVSTHATSGEGGKNGRWEIKTPLLVHVIGHAWCHFKERRLPRDKGEQMRTARPADIQRRQIAELEMQLEAAVKRGLQQTIGRLQNELDELQNAKDAAPKMFVRVNRRSWHDGLLQLQPGAQVLVRSEAYGLEFLLSYLSVEKGLVLTPVSAEQDVAA